MMYVRICSTQARSCQAGSAMEWRHESQRQLYSTSTVADTILVVAWMHDKTKESLA